MGRKAVPTVLRLMRGNPGKRPINDREPRPPALSIMCPRELVELEARREWRRTIAPAIRIGQITVADRVLAVAHCDLWATWRAQVGAAGAGPHVQAVGANAYPTPNVARGMANRTLLLLVKVDAELGLSPTARSRVTVAPRRGEVPTTGGPLDRFLKKRSGP